MGTLYLVGTPIGNLEDITYRAVRILREVDLIASEDTRHSGRLLKHFEISTRQVSFHGHSPEKRIEMILDELESHDVALISDAGMPAISDPGSELVRAVVDRGFPVAVVPGPSAVTSAVALSGLAESGFLFAGYAPRRSGERLESLTRWGLVGFPIVLFESPHRIAATLQDIHRAFPESHVSVCRELTKLHEEVVRGTASELAAYFEADGARGEFVIVIDQRSPESVAEDSDALARLLLDRGMSVSAAARELAPLAGMPRSEAYALLMKVRGDSERRSEED